MPQEHPVRDINVNGVIPQLDSTDILAVSLWGKSTSAGDTAVIVDSTGHLQVDVLSITAGDTNIGNVDIASIAAGDNNIGNVDIASAIPAGTANIGGTTDQHAAWTTVWGVSNACVESADLTSVTAVTGAPTAGQKLVITDIIVSTDTAMNVLFEEETTGTNKGRLYLPANGSAQLTTRGKFKLDTADKKLTAVASVAGNLSIMVGYYSEL